jgi:hypothetical protein
MPPQKGVLRRMYPLNEKEGSVAKEQVDISPSWNEQPFP